MPKVISQSENYKGNFGIVLRSSAIFYYKLDKLNQFKTTVSFLNYWKLKRDIDIKILASLRDMKGGLIERFDLDFDKNQVINIDFSDAYDFFEGSLELEIFSVTNMVIPYAAVMAVYESKKSISMVHSYTRTYSQHEIEENRTISIGKESCWTIRDNKINRSFCVMHNGSERAEKQKINLTLTTSEKSIYQEEISIPALSPYQTLKLYPSKLFKDLSGKLNNKIGNMSIDFELKNSFSRLLVGHESSKGDDFQVTHSNFNYSKHSTDEISNKKPGIMQIINEPIQNPQMIIYPDSSPGEYVIENSDDSFTFSTGEVISVSPKSNVFSVRRVDKTLPTRIVTGFSGSNKALLPFECSLGFMNENRPEKRMWWGLVYSNKNIKSKIFVLPYEEFYGKVDPELQINLRLYSSNSNAFLETNVSFSKFKGNKGKKLENIFDGCDSFLGGEPGYFTLYSEYGGFIIYSMLIKDEKARTLEHCF